MKTKLLVVIFIFSSLSWVNAQSELELVKSFIAENKSETLLLVDDYSDLLISSQHYSESTGVEHIYVQQAYMGVPIFNAIGSFAVKDNNVKYANYNFEYNLAKRAVNQKPSLSPEEALNVVSTQLGLDMKGKSSILKSNSSTDVILSNSSVSIDNIPVKLVYHNSENGVLELAWDLSLHMPDGSHWWSIRVDAINGRILEKNDWTVYCNFDHSSSLSRKFRPSTTQGSISERSSAFTDGSTYNVFPYPVESPNHGVRELVSNPSDVNFSPFGWHDTNGIGGAEFTITRGNNVHAYEDISNQNIPGSSPDGGETLNFDFQLDLNRAPQFNQAAAITNLFYWNNIVHDMWAHYGFDEAAGNFQETNYTGVGLGNDYVRAEALDGDGLNNANFATPPDGSRSRMQMYLWSPSGPLENPLSIESPQRLVGDYNAVLAAFGPSLSTRPVSVDFALALDGESTADPTDACEVLVNAQDLNRKIVLIRRGSCAFVDKILKAQEAGARAVIMVNNIAGDPISMGGDDIGITIPSIMISQADGDPIIQALQNDETVRGVLVNNGPFQIDGDFDNGIIAHEYGHGISTRLTGGASVADCLRNEEQMGEGWSDWIALMMTINQGDISTQGRGIGTFATSQPTEGTGIRPFRYSTDRTVNPATYGLTNDLNLSVPHGIGFVWATMLWDLNWALIERYGFDSDLYTGTGGNNISMQLVIDGMKLQACEPGFIDGRDAILEADRLANNGANQCLIWQVFADRGLGWSAEQGDTDNREDQVEAFDLPPSNQLNCSLSNDSFGFNTFQVYPNPAKESFRLSLTDKNLADVKVDIYNLTGQLVISKVTDQNQKVDIQTLGSGVYIVMVESDNKVYTKKLIVQ